jgi:hypothetical protein
MSTDKKPHFISHGLTCVFPLLGRWAAYLKRPQSKPKKFGEWIKTVDKAFGLRKRTEGSNPSLTVSFVERREKAIA